MKSVKLRIKHCSICGDFTETKIEDRGFKKLPLLTCTKCNNFRLGCL